MLNDREAVELLSRSMRGEASAVDLAKLSTYLEASPETRAFAEWAQRIEDSVVDAAMRASAGDSEVAPGLSDEAKRRLSDSVHAALTASQTATLAGRIDTDGMAGSTHREAKLRSEDSTAVPVTQTTSWTASHGSLGEVAEGRRMASRFTLIRKLGEGGLGTVWLARDERLRRNVALKEMSAAAAMSPAAWKRFQREAEITGHLEHPNVVPIYQSGVDPDSGLPFYVMRFLGKKTLAAAIVEYHQRRMAGERSAVEFHRLLTAFLGVCQAVAYAHSRHVVHRDLKPENIALDHFGQVLVLDWGLAKHLDDADPTGGTETLADAHEGLKTVAGEVVGTPLYMAPEQAAGRLDEIDERTDVYGLGAILFAILTGQAPHENSASSQQGRPRVAQLLEAIAQHDPPNPRSIDSSVPRELDEICHRAMSRVRALRFDSAEELAESVQSWMAGQHEKLRRYDNLRMEGRDLRAGLAAAVRSLRTNSRFMAGLPTIQGLVSVDLGRPGDDRNLWRERLSAIFVGLLQANTDFSAVSFARVEEKSYRELVRVERRGTDGACRAVPMSRLGTSPACPFLERVVAMKPDDSLATLMSEGPGTTPGIASASVLCAAVPVFDAVTEEPFGAVVVEADFSRLVDRIHRERIRTTKSVTVADPEARILFYAGPDGARVPANTCCNDVEQACPKIIETLSRQEELVDEMDQEWYATRLELESGGDFLALVLQAGDG